jgi:hypothetical protein
VEDAGLTSHTAGKFHRFAQPDSSCDIDIAVLSP